MLASPTRDPLGRPRSPVTLPEYRRGVKPANAGLKLPPEPLSRREIDALLATFSRRSPSGVRNRALIVLMWRAGLRIAEVLALAVKDVDLDAGHVRVLHGKGDQSRVVGLDPFAVAVLDDWATARRRVAGLPRSAPFFCTISQPVPGRPVWHSYVRQMLKDHAVKAGVEKRVHPHGFRHTCAFELMKEGLPMVAIQRHLGHSNLDTTARYVSHLTGGEVVAMVQARSV